MKKVSRRRLGKIVAGVAAARALPLAARVQTPARSNYIGPLTGVGNEIEGRRFDPVAFTRDLYAAAPRRRKRRVRLPLERETGPVNGRA